MRFYLQNLSLFVRRQMPAVLAIVLLLCAGVGGSLLGDKKALAATNGTMNFQARLMNGSGSIAIDGFYNIEFKLYDASTSSGSSQGSCTGDANCLWTETYYDTNGVTAGNDFRVRVANGYVTVNLGSLTAFPSTINWDQGLWLTMNVGGTTQTATPTYDGEMSPRLKLTGVPYAFRAGQLGQFNSSTGFTSTLGIVPPTGGNQTFVLPDQGAAGTYNVLTTATAATSFVQLQGTTPGTPQVGHFNISGTGIAGALQSASLDTPSGTTTLNIGTTNATTAVNLGSSAVATVALQAGTTLNVGNNANNKTINIGVTGATANTTTVNLATSTGAAQTVNIGSTNGASALTLRVGTGNFSLDGAAGSTYTLGASTTTGAITIGGTAQTGTIDIGTGTGAQALNFGTGGTGAKTVTVGSTASTGATTIQSGTGDTTIQSTDQVILNAGSTIELQDSANVSGNLDVSGTLTSGTGNAFQVDAGGNVTAGTYNTNTFNGTTLTFGSAATATIQSAGSQALTITGNAASTWSTSSGDLTVQAAASLNLKAVTGSVVIGTSDTTGTPLVVDIKTNAGDPSGTDGAIYYNSNSGTFRCYQGGTWTNCITATGGMVTLQNAYDNGNTISTDASGDIAFTLNNQNFTVANAAGATGSTTFSLTDGSNGSPAAQLVLITNNDVNEAIANGLTVSSAAGTIIDGLDVSDADLVNAINVGDNIILGTTATIDFTNFDVSSAGAVVAVGVNSGTGLLQGTGGLTLTGTTSVNNNTNSNTSINLGTSTGTITLGGGSAPLVIDSTNFDVTSAGAVSGVTTLSTSGIITQGSLGSADSATYLCRNISNQIASCNTTGTGAAFVQGGNTFGATATLGTNDSNQLDVRTNSTTRLTVGATGGVTVAAGNNLSLASGSGTFSQTYTGTTTDAHTITANSLTTASALKLTSSNNSAANTAWSAVSLGANNLQGTTAVSTGSIVGLDFQFTQNTSVAGNTETAANFALAQNNSSSTDATVSSIVNLANNDTATGNQITATDGLKINGANITNGINLSGTFGTNLITSTNFSVSQAGAIVGVGINSGTGLLQGTGGLTLTGTTSINNNSNNNVSINTGTSTGTMTLGGGSAPLVIDSTNFDVTSAGAVSGVTTLSTSGIITQGTLGAADNLTYLCRNTSNQIANCNAAGAGAAFVQGGNTFGATATLGTNDSNQLDIRTNSTTRLTVGATGGVTVAAGNNLSLASGSGTFSQTYTGTSTDAHTVTANSLTTASALKVTSSNNSAANTAWSGVSLGATNLQGTTAVSTGTIAALDLQLTQNTSVAGNTETVANLAVAQNNNSSTDATVSSILNLANNDTATGNQIAVTDGLKINGANVTNGINLSGTFGTNLITSTNFSVSQAGAIVGVGVNSGTGLLQGTGGLTLTGTTSINNNSNNNVSINTGTSTGTITLGGGSAPLVIDSTNFDVTSAGAVSGVTTLSTSGIITQGTLGAADSLAYLCRNTSNQIASCNTTGAGAAFVQGGNTFGATATLGTNDSNQLDIRTNSTTRLTVGATGGVTVAAGNNLSLASGTGTFSQTYTGTTTDAHTITANSLTTASALRVTSSNNSAANTAWSALSLAATNLQGTTAVSTGTIAGLDFQFTQNTGVAGNTETVANFALAQNNSSSTDAAVSSILNLANNDTATGNQIAVTDGIKVNGANVTNGINLSGTFGTSLITSTNFSVSQAGAIVGVGVNSGTGLIQGTGGLTITGTTSINNNANNNVSINTGTSTGTITLGGGSAPFVIDSTNFDVTSAGAVSGVTTLNTSGIITQGTLGAADSLAYLCRNTSNQIASCNTTGTGAAFVQGGNTFGATATLGTNDSNQLDVRTNSTTRLTVGATGGVTVAAGNNLSLASGTGTFSQAYTGTTTDAHTITANSLTTASALKVTSSNNSAANTAWSAVSLAASNLQGTTAVSTGTIAGLDFQFTQNTSVAGNTETAANFAITQNNSSSTDATVSSIINLANNDTATGNQITATDGIRINGANVTNGLNLSGTFGTSLITSTNFSVSQAGAIVGVGINSGTGLIQGTGGLTLTGTTSINNNSNNNVSINTGTSTGTITLGGGSAPLVIDSTNFDVTSAGAVSGVTTLNTSGIITQGALGAADSATYLCRNTSNQIASCNTTGTGVAFVQGGNTFGATATLGTNDSNQLDVRTNSTTRLTVGATGGVTVAAGNNLSLASGAGTFSQTYTGTTTDAHTITANSLTTASALKVTSSNNSAANTAWSAVSLGASNLQGTTAVSTGSIAGLDFQLTQNTSVAGNTETVANFAVAQNNSSSTDATVSSILNLANNDTATGNQIAVTDGLKINGANVTNGLNLSGTFGTSLITSTNFSVSQAGAVVGVGVNSGTGLIQGTGGLTITGVTSINNNANNNTSINTGTSTGTITLGGGSAPLVIDSTNFDVTSAGALSGITTISTSSTINSQTISSTANFTGTVTIQGANALTLGVTGTSTGAVLFKGATGASNTLTLIGPANPSANTLTLPNETGTICSTGSICTGYAATPASGSYIKQVPTTTAENTITPAANSVVGLTVNATSGTAAIGAVINQALGADALNLNVTGSSQTNGMLVNRTNAGTLTNGINITNTSGTVTNGLAFTGTIGTDINRSSGILSIQGTGGVTITAGGTTTAAIDTAGAGTVTLGNTTATTINIGGTSGATTTIAGGNVAHTVAIASAGTSTIQGVTIGSTGSTSTLTLQAGTGTATGDINIGDQTTASKIIDIGSNDNAGTGTVRIATGAAVQGVTIGSTNSTSTTVLQGGTGTATGDINIGDQTTAGKILDIGSNDNAGTGTVRIATGAAVQTVTMGSTNSTSVTTIQGGTGTANGDINIGDQTTAGKIIDIGSVTNAGTSTVRIATGAAVQTVTVGSTNTTSTLNLQGGTGTATGDINIGDQTTAGKIIHIGSVDNAGTGTIRIATAAAVQDVMIGSTNSTSTTRIQAGSNNLIFDVGGTVRGTFDNANSLYLGNGVTAASPNAFTVRGTGALNAATAGALLTVIGGTGNTSGVGGGLTLQGGTGGNAATGGAVTVQGGSAGGGNTNGANLNLVGGASTGSGVKGLVVLDTVTYSTATTQSSASNVNITQANIDSFGAVVLNATATSVAFTLSDPTLGASAAGRIVYVIAANASNDFTLRANVGEGLGIEQNIAMRQNTTATMVWTGTNWTAAGASSSTTLQSAYDSTLSSAGGAEIVLNNSATANGLTVRNNATNPIIGAILEAQTSVGSNLFSVNNNATEYANNGGGESSTFTMWAGAPAGGTATQYTTQDSNIATGAASVFANATATANTGIKNTLTAALTPNLKYTVSFAIRHTSSTIAFTTLDIHYSNDGTAVSSACATGQTVTNGRWTRIICSFTAPSSGITSSNAVFIRHSDAVDHDFYVDNLSVSVSANVNHVADGSVDAALGSNWTAFGAGTAVSLESTIIYDTSGSVQVDTTNNTNRGVTNNLTIFPSVSTQYLVTFYARLDSGTFTDIRVQYSRDGGTDLEACVDYNTRTLSTTGWTKITCLVTTDGTTATNADLIIDQPTAPGGTRIFYVDALSMTLNTNTASNVQVGGGNKGGPPTLFTLDRSSGAPIADNNDAYLGSMYYDTISGRIQCYEADGWGACGAAPDNIVNLNPEYAGAVLNGSGIGTMTADFCSDDTALLINVSLCETGQAKNFYKWTSPQATEQVYSIYVTYQLPATFNGFSSDDTIQLVARTDSTTNAAVTYEMFKSTGSAVTRCGSAETTVVTTANIWQSVGVNGNEATGCTFSSSSAGNFVIFKINVKAKSNANAYVSTLSFTTIGR